MNRRRSARERAELLWWQHTRRAATNSRSPDAVRDTLDTKIAHLRAHRTAMEANRPRKSPRDRNDSHWLRHFGRRLGELYEPDASIPQGMQELIDALTARIDT